MGKNKCDYCGEYYNETYGGTLDNGSPACPECVADEEKRKLMQQIKGSVNTNEK